MIQENQEIGKVSNLIPPLMEKALEFFLIDIIKKSAEVTKEAYLVKLHPFSLKKAIQNMK